MPLRPRTEYKFAALQTKAGSLASIAMLCLLTLVILLSVPFPQPVETGLDGSWRLALSQLQAHEYAKTPIIFTYGIGGFLVRGAATEATFGPIIIFRMLVFAAYSATLARYYFTGRDSLSRLFTLVAFSLPAFLSLVKPYFQTEYQLAMLTPLALFASGSTSHVSTRIAILSLFSGLLFHSKTSLFYHSFPVIVAYILSTGLLKREFSIVKRTKKIVTELLISIACCGLGVIIPYFIFTGSPLPAYSLLREISSGYSEGMGQGEINLQLCLAAIVLLLWATTVTIILIKKRDFLNSSVLGSLLPLTFIIILSFKHGFVRQGHAPRFFVISMVIYSILLTYEEFCNGSSLANTRKILRSGFVATSIIAYVSALGPILSSRSMIENLGASLQMIGNPFAVKSIIAKRTESNTKRVILPTSALRKIGRETIDIIPRELSIAYANQLNWKPRPTVQSYQGYTEKLDRLNAKHIRTAGPQFILLHYDSIDEKNQAFYSPSEWVELLCRYKAVSSFDSQYLGLVTLLEKLKETRCSDLAKLNSITGHINQVIPLGNLKPNTILALSISIRLNLVGLIHAAALRGATVGVKLHYPGGLTTETIRFAPTNARNGLLVYPLSGSGKDLYCLFRSPLDCDKKIPEAISVITQHPELFNSTISVIPLVADIKTPKPAH